LRHKYALTDGQQDLFLLLLSLFIVKLRLSTPNKVYVGDDGQAKSIMFPPPIVSGDMKIWKYWKKQWTIIVSRSQPCIHKPTKIKK